jgi:hypothetical protein
MKTKAVLAIASLLFAVACSSGGYKILGNYGEGAYNSNDRTEEADA